MTITQNTRGGAVNIGIIVPLGEQEALGRPFHYREVREFALLSESRGLDSVWIYDHLLYRFPGRPPSAVWEGFTTWTALAEATSRIQLGALVLCTAFRNPALTAKMAVTLDEISGGRIILGLGAGWHEPEFHAFGIPFDHLVDRFEEACRIIVPLVREGTVDFTGSYYSAPNCEMLPRPRRRIPVLIAAFKPRMLRLTAEFADAWNTAWLGQVDGLASRRDALERACAEVGRAPGSLEVTVGLNIAFPDLGTVPEQASDPKKYISGSVHEVAAGLASYAAAGVSHVICSIAPLTTESIGMLADAANQVRSQIQTEARPV
ncbi:MAG: LLM class F420-dependent oxidoreductase [Chloroflexota bacterium]